MSLTSIPVWTEAPFLRLLLPLVAGILVQWHIHLPSVLYWTMISASLVLIIAFSYIDSFIKFRSYWLPGIGTTLLFIAIGGAVTYCCDFRNYSNCITRVSHEKNVLIVTLEEPLSEKDNSFKATASVSQVFYTDSMLQVKGNVIIYFKKDSSLKNLGYNSRLAFKKALQPIVSPGNPGAFDYKSYCAFQQIFYQVYLKPGDYEVLPIINDHYFKKWLFSSRRKITDILRSNIPGKKEAGLAEALLIGYKDDLDKGLVQSYSNTGVVHIIAISGLHLGLIYWLLTMILRPLGRKGKLKLLKAILIISGLWVFSLLAGGSASVCRSALMFSFIVIGENIGRRTNIYNSLAASAFLLLCYNPFWLWDAGFQLSYIAVLSIVIFMKPVYHWFFIKNKILDNLWKMAAMSISAQVLTTPVSIFHFHQFPNYFLLTNLVAVPLSSLIVLSEISLCAVALLPSLARPSGFIISGLIYLMNSFIEYIDKLPFSVMNLLQVSIVQLVLVYLAIFALRASLLQKNKSLLLAGMLCIGFFGISKVYFLKKSLAQHKLIVYNVPHHQAIDLVQGRQCLFLGDSALLKNKALQNFHLTPSRILYRINDIVLSIPCGNDLKMISAGDKKIIIVNASIEREPAQTRSLADIVILSGNPVINLSKLQELTGFKKLILDSSIPAWKVSRWKSDCEKGGISFHAVSEKGAFILNLN